MESNVAKEVATLGHMTASELRDRYHEVFGEHTNARNKQWLINRIAWKLQANAEADISERARRLAHKIAMETDTKTGLPRVNDHHLRKGQVRGNSYMVFKFHQLSRPDRFRVSRLTTPEGRVPTCGGCV